MPTTTSGRGVDGLLDLQQSDGGWAYSTNGSWTEPTAYGILALRASGGAERAVSHACEWLARRQRADGGWSPGTAVEQSTHVTSLAVLALSGAEGYEDIAERGVQWILRQAGAESSMWARMTRFVMGTRSKATEHSGWPWLPGASAWVIPTSLSIFALLKHRNGHLGSQIGARVEEARGFLLNRRCPDYGWNHGGLYREGETPSSYPETTGIALLALKGASSSELGQSVQTAERHARDPRSSEGAYWLRLGLSAHGRSAAAPAVEFRNWTVNQIALGILTEKGPKSFIADA